MYLSRNPLEVFFQVDEDEPLFLSLISDLFPGIQLDNATYEDLQVAIQHQVDEAKMVNHPSWNLKIVQVSVSITISNSFFSGDYFTVWKPQMLFFSKATNIRFSNKKHHLTVNSFEIRKLVNLLIFYLLIVAF